MTNIKGKAICIGKFEALHLGHLELINATQKYAQNHNLQAAIMSFSPNPIQVLHNQDYKPLFSEAERKFQLAKMFDNLDYIQYSFDKNLINLSPQEFCQILKNELNCKTLIAGESIHIGKNRSGTAEVLQKLGMTVIAITNLKHGSGEKISTSQIRKFLYEGQLQEVNRLLGRPFMIMGRVQKGRQLGRTIGFPTANVHPAKDKLLPPDGVYACKIIVNDAKHKGIANIGKNPTIASGQSRRVEAHIFNFDADIYDEEVIVELHSFIRPERNFGGLEELKAQIAVDADSVRFYDYEEAAMPYYAPHSTM